MAYDIEGPLFFGAARNFVREIERESSYRVIILNMQSVPVIDTTGALALEDIVDRIRRDRKKLIIAGLRKEVRTVLHRLGVSQKIGVGNFAGDLRAAPSTMPRLTQPARQNGCTSGPTSPRT